MGFGGSGRTYPGTGRLPKAYILNKVKFSDAGKNFSIFLAGRVLRFHRGIVRPRIAIIGRSTAS
jgi:hypothetical protein